MPNVAQVMRRELKKIAHDASVRDAAKRMRDERVGSLRVERENNLSGIVTETDVGGRGLADAENGHQLCSRSAVSLRRTEKGTPQSPPSLRPRWLTVLSILLEVQGLRKTVPGTFFCLQPVENRVVVCSLHKCALPISIL